MPDGGLALPSGTTGRIGPNAILQLTEPVERTLGSGAMARLLELAGTAMPSGYTMIDEGDVARIFRALYAQYPASFQRVTTEAGIGTARYIQENRIPAAARVALRLLPAFIGEPLLTRAITAHAWTFCGSGSLRASVGSKVRFELRDNPVLRGLRARAPLCYWHTAVFETLFTGVLGRPYAARETACCTMGTAACQFEVVRR